MYNSLDTQRFRRPPNNLNLFNQFPYSKGIAHVVMAASPGTFSVTGEPTNQALTTPLNVGLYKFAISFQYLTDDNGNIIYDDNGNPIVVGTGVSQATLGVGNVVASTALDYARFKVPPNDLLKIFNVFPYSTQNFNVNLIVNNGTFSFTGDPANLVQQAGAIQVSALEHMMFSYPPRNLNLFNQFPYSVQLNPNAHFLTVTPGSFGFAGNSIQDYTNTVYQKSKLDTSGSTAPPFNLNLFNQFPYSTFVTHVTSQIFSPGSFGFTGQSVGLSNNLTLSISSGTFSFTGDVATFGSVLAAGSGTYSVNGQSVNLAEALPLGLGNFGFFGEPVVTGAFTALVPGSFSVTGEPTNQALTTPLTQGTYAYTGGDTVGLGVGVILNAATFSMTGNAVTFSLPLSKGHFGFFGHDINVKGVNNSIVGGMHWPFTST